ncbi:hypothetical protein CDD82_609 [Ophiocordyceps australis]|uniref:ABC transporter n=1 Tax=Ophiocordyceps australis TaxID=1399860 RepID=A0A2C5ZKC3_9HYPO|nr:hypothetical protein CDD82_609 [Ophiocordyceps australis]
MDSLASNQRFRWFKNARIVPAHSISPSGVTILATLAALAVALLCIYVLQHRIIARLPLWLKPFAKDEDLDGHNEKRKKWTHWTLVLGIIGLTGLVLAIVPTFLNPRQPVIVLDIVPWLCVCAITAYGRPIKTPRLLLMLYILVLMGNVVSYSIQFLHGKLDHIDPLLLGRTALAALGFMAIGLMPMRSPSRNSDDIGKPQLAPSYLFRSPEDNLTMFQWWTVTWVKPLARIARFQDLAVQDVWQLPLEFQHKRLYMAFRDLPGRLVPRLIRANGLDLFIATSLCVGEKISEATSIRLTSRLYKSLDSNNPQEAIFWCLAMLSVDVIRQTCKTCSSWHSRKAYERSRGESFIGLFDKLMTRTVPGSDVTEKGLELLPVKTEESRLTRVWKKCRNRASRDDASGQEHDDDAYDPASNAKVVNLVRGDTYELSQRFWEFPRLVAQPIKIILSIYYLIDIMGWPSCVGLGLMVLFLTANTLLVRQVVKLERQRTTLSDRRAQAVAHFVEASRALKLNGWTAAWSHRILRFRKLEMSKRLQIARVTAAIQTVNVAGGAAYPLVSIVFFALVFDRGMPNDVVWPSLQLFGQLETSVKETFELVASFWKATIPVERVHKFMKEPDRDESAFVSSPPGVIRDIEFRDASFSWPSSKELVLSHVTLRFPPGLTLIRGPVGSGKSSLLLAALNEMQIHGGEVIRPQEAIGYAQQLPWLQSKTIRENIVFHHPFDAARYRNVINACALAPDLASLPDGDQTKLEEGGVGLSGGQKARVALARAVYSPCRLLLLDDPLSALDFDTASSIVKQFLLGPLAQGRSIVMVTHRDDLVLRHAQQVVNIDNGRARTLSAKEIGQELEHPIHLEVASGTCKDGDGGAHDQSAEDVVGLKEAPEEPAETGSIPLSVFIKYIRAGGILLWLLLAMFYSASRYCDISRAQLLEAWGKYTADGHGPKSRGYWGLPDPERNPRIWLGVLSGLSGGQVAAYLAAQLLLASISINAAQGLFKTAISHVSKATFRYHDTTPTGQLKNRLIADMGMVDGGILAPLEGFVFNLIAFVLSLVAVSIHQPLLLIILAAVAALFILFFRTYVPVSRCLRRMEMRYLTPIISNIGVMQDGLVTIRAFRVETKFQDRHLVAVDDFQKHDHFFWSMCIWLDYRLGLTSACTRALLVIVMILGGTEASSVGFVLTQATLAITAVQQLCEKFAMLQLDAVSLERVVILNRIPEEPNTNGDDDSLPLDWPTCHDNINFEGVSFRYADDLPDVLQDVSFMIPGGSTCAVLGRTGSGKSTIANALLATESVSEGTARIGDIDLARVNRTALRHRVTFIQQDPTLFPGTLRDNLDPEGRYSESACASAIERVLGSGWGLETNIDAGGKNLSQGQRQLVGIGRAVLRRSGLVILDEATASIDRNTAAAVQRVLRQELADSTVVTIAHRLEAVEDADWVLRLDQGQVVRCGPASGEGF